MILESNFSVTTTTGLNGLGVVLMGLGVGVGRSVFEQDRVNEMSSSKNAACFIMNKYK
ncbi:MAG: hypothetical protein KA534_06910 [Sediminibacterium sp.]|nr:hypothetical protein [Sediminibacterium sp.]